MAIGDRRVRVGPIATRAALVPTVPIALSAAIAAPAQIAALVLIVALVQIGVPVQIGVIKATVPIGIVMSDRIVPTGIEAPPPRRRPSARRPQNADRATRGAIVPIAPESRARAKVRRVEFRFPRKLRSDAFARSYQRINRRP